ncbi:hypothetical protein MSG28_011864 [Choristoneura fumiferana]|uniref:Uncharacterized protein n=1 Tax=Choristoneura fumiferana TaxID=7141 RepID=A0ACC0KMA7_CHOFU|nr:hypothetical protein MSG28_011864 [Choristoneura fumiferana]
MIMQSTKPCGSKYVEPILVSQYWAKVFAFALVAAAAGSQPDKRSLGWDAPHPGNAWQPVVLSHGAARGAKARAAAAQKIAAAREAAAARAIHRAAHNQAARLQNAAKMWSAFGLLLAVASIQLVSANSDKRRFSNPTYYNVGGVLSSNESVAFFKDTISNLNFKDHYVPKGVTYHDYSILMDPNPIKTALNVCKDLIAHRVYAVVVSHPLTGDLSPAAVSYTSGFYHIPVIGISSRDSAFSDKNIHVSFLRTVPPYSHQADVWVDVLKHFNYMKVIFIHSSDTDGRAILGRFQTTSQSVDEDVDRKVVVEQVIEFEPGLDSFTDKLIEVKSAQARVYLMYASKTDAESIFRDATLLNMTTAGYVWVVTEQALDAENAPEGLLGLRLVNATNEHAHIQDSIYVLASAIRDMNTTEEINAPPSDCDNSGTTWNTGRHLFDYVRKQRLESGATGHVAFDDHGDRVNAEYDMVNVRLQGEHVLTIEEKPFVYTRRIDDGSECTPEEIPCPHYNASDDTDQMYCCKGFCMDLLKHLSTWINFTYSLALSPDGQFGHYVIRNLSHPGAKKEWTGLIGELVYERADMIVAPLTINPERAEFIEFSKPFKYQGITILEKKPSRSSTLVSFLQPFSNTLWILVMVSVHVVALVLYLLDRFSPFGRFKLANIDGTEEDALNLSSAIWFAWGVLLNSGIGEGTPRSFSARVLGMVWAGFAMIIVASYTANLAAFLVLERPKTKLTGINDARLRNTMENLTCATVKGSGVDMYFRRQVELSNMYRTMEANNYDNAEQAIQDVKNGKLMAFIWDSSRLEFEAAQDCELVTAGELFGRSGYGVGLQKGSPWADWVTLAILDFHESGIMESLDNNWILRNNLLNCEENEKTPNTLGLKNMAGVFILVLAGIIGGIVLIVIEVVYKRHQIKKQKRMEIARHAADRWRGTVEKRKTLRASILPTQRRAKSNGVKEAGSISLAVDRGARRRDEPRVPRYLPAYTPDVSHLVMHCCTRRQMGHLHLFLEFNLFFFFLIVFHDFKPLLLNKTALLDVELLLGLRIDFLCLFIGLLFDEGHHMLDLSMGNQNILTSWAKIYVLKPNPIVSNAIKDRLVIRVHINFDQSDKFHVVGLYLYHTVMANLNFQQAPRSLASGGVGGRVGSGLVGGVSGHVTPTFGGALSPGRGATAMPGGAPPSMASRSTLFGQRAFADRRVPMPTPLSQPNSNAMTSMGNLSRFNAGSNYHSVFGEGGDTSTPPLLDLSEFPSLTARVGMVKQPTTEQSEFTMSSEDFPALPGTSTGAAPAQPPVHLLPDANHTADKPRKGIQTSPEGKVTNIPETMIPNQFGIVGLLTFIRAAESDPSLVSLALGQDLTALGLNLNSPDNLYLTFAGPWADTPCRPQDMDYHVPPEYLINGSIREKLAPLRLSRYKEDLLFYLFYCFVGDVLQIAAAAELYNREWRYHMEEKVWISQAPGMPMVEKTPTLAQCTLESSEKRLYRQRKNFKIMNMDASTVLTEYNVIEILKVVAESCGITDWNYSVHNFESVGQNYFGVLVPFTLTGGNVNREEVTIQLVLKLAPTDKRFRLSDAVTRMFDREIFVYSTVLSKYQEMQKGLTENHYIIPRCYYTSNKYCEEVIVMQDMRETGYKPYSEGAFLDLDHILVSVKALAKFHALSFILKQTDSKLFCEIEEKCVPLNESTDKRFFDVLKDRLQKALDKFCNTEYDFKLSEACLIDYQSSRMCSPAYDILYLITSSTDSDLRHNHVGMLLDTYYKTFESYLRAAGKDAANIYPKESFESDLKVVGPAVFIVANTALWLSNGLQQQGHVRSKQILSTDEEKSNAVRKYTSLIKSIIDDYTSYGYLCAC